MMAMSKKILIAVFLVVILPIMLFNIYERLFETKGVENRNKCEALRSGITENEITEILGAPIATHPQKDGKLLMFETPNIQSENIEAKVDNAGIVIGIKCREGEGWK